MIARATGTLEALLPGGHVPAIVLFCSPHPSSAAMRAKFEAAAWPSGYRVCAFDLAQEPAARAWFNLSEEPTVAVVLDGVILALESECTDEACRRLLRVAEAQRRRFDEI